MSDNKTYLQPQSTLQLIAITTIIIGHFWVKDNSFMNSLGVCFCFIYSGFFTGSKHEFGPSYGIKDHARFMWNKLARLYPLHILAIALTIVAFRFNNIIGAISIKTMLAHLTMLSTWFSSEEIYFGYNPVAWYICDLMFLYLMAPLVIRLLRKIKLGWQVVLIGVLFVLEFIGGYDPNENSHPLLLTKYYLYEFPPIRLIDFAAGVVIYNATQSNWWQQVINRLNAMQSTVIEVAGIIAFAVLYWVGKNFLHPYCPRAFCVTAPATVALFIAFIITSKHVGLVSRALSVEPFKFLSGISFELYLLQTCVFFLLIPALARIGIPDINSISFITITLAVMVIVAWLVHRFFVKPLNNLLRSR